jgi:quercetin dioxygenase-like cupin family protein
MDNLPDTVFRRSIVARAGQEIYNPVQDDRMVFRKASQDTGGELLRVELFVSPRGGNPLHVHPLQEEYFKALSGTLGVQVGEGYRRLEEGEEALVLPGTPHRWWNDTDQEAHVLVELRPTLNSEIYFETLYGLARDGKTDENGLPNLLQQAVTLTGVNRGEIYLARPPIPLQKALLATLAPLGKLLGYKDHYPKYSAAAEPPSVEGAGPPSTTSVMARGVALVITLLVSSLFLLRWARRLLSKG